MNKRDFLKSGAGAVVAGTGSTVALAVVAPTPDGLTGLAGWQAQVGRGFEVDGHAVTLAAVQPRPGMGTEQFSLSFSGALPAGMGDGLHRLTRAGGGGQTLYLARTPQGLRADFCRLRG
jgi:hypothetical protein